MNNNKKMSKTLAPSGAYILVGGDMINMLNMKQGEGQGVLGVGCGEGCCCFLQSSQGVP